MAAIRLSPAQGLFFFTSTAIVGLVGFIANALVIAAILSSRELRASAMNILLVNMAFADLLFIVLITSVWCPQFYTRTYQWFLPPFHCYTHNYLASGMILASILTYLVIAIERYLVIVHPMSFSSRSRVAASKKLHRILLTIAALWLLVAVYELPNLLLTFRLHSRSWANTTIHFCFNAPYTTPILVFRWSEAAVTYVIPIIVSAVLYTKICQVLWGKANQGIYVRDHISKRVKKSIMKRLTTLKRRDSERKESADAAVAAVENPSGLTPSSTTHPPPSSQPSKQASALTERRNVVKMMITCVTVFFLCYTPSVIGFVAYNIFAYAFTIWFTPLVILLETLCSSVNPFIYTLFSERIRQRVGEMLRPLWPAWCRAAVRRGIGGEEATSSKREGGDESNNTTTKDRPQTATTSLGSK